MRWLWRVDEVGGESTDLDDFDFEPVDIGDFSYGNFHLVGHGDVTNGNCGKFRSFYGCSRVDLHNKITLGGKNFKGKVYMRKIFHSCDKPSCPVCYKYGWAVRESGKIEKRLAEASKRFGQVEHIVVTVPPKFYGLSYQALRAKIIQICRRRDIVGGVMIFHGFRYNLRKHWYWSPHFHVLGFIRGGYGRCRGCKGCFKGCGGWEDRKYRAYEKDGCIVRVLGKRRTVGGTAWYQLNHSSIDVTKKRYHVAVWFGVCSYNKMKIDNDSPWRRNVCPICQNALREHRYLGSNQTILNYLRSDIHSCKKRDFVADLEENGRIAWIEKDTFHVSRKYADY